MEVSLNANKCDRSTEQIARVLRAAFSPIAKDLSKDYGGTMRYLWIDFELIQYHAEQRPSWPFRFQKKVGGSRSGLTGLPMPVYENVGHYGISPDFKKLLNTPLDSVAGYALSLIHASTWVLVAKQKKLGGFHAQRFRSDFCASCNRHGFEITPSVDAG